MYPVKYCLQVYWYAYEEREYVRFINVTNREDGNYEYEKEELWTRHDMSKEEINAKQKKKRQILTVL